MSNRSIGYLWLSPDSQKESDTLIRLKQGRVERYCQSQQLELDSLRIDTAVTSAIQQRPELQKILDGLEHYDFVIVDSLADIGRRFHDVYQFLSRFQATKTQFISIAEQIHTGTHDGQVLLTSLQQIPQLIAWRGPEPDAPRQRNRMSRYNGGACPYGYEIDEQSNEYRSVPEEAAIIKRIFRERLAGRSLRQIANSLTQEGIRTKRGGRWQANTIKTILENVFYTGAYQTQGKLFHNNHEAIISEYQFQQVNALDLCPSS